MVIMGQEGGSVAQRGTGYGKWRRGKGRNRWLVRRV